MVVLGGWRFLMSEVPLYSVPRRPWPEGLNDRSLQKKKVALGERFLGTRSPRGGACGQRKCVDLIAASIHDNYSVGPSIRPICTRCCLTMTYMIQVCSYFR